MILNWKTGGVLLGAVFFAAVLLVKPIGVSTQFVIFDGILWDAVNPDVVVPSETAKSGYASPNAYLNKCGGSYAKNVANPLNYSFVFVIAMIAGAAVSALLRGGVAPDERQMPAVWRANFGDSPWRRYAWAFVGGFVVLYGARLAGGPGSARNGRRHVVGNGTAIGRAGELRLHLADRPAGLGHLAGDERVEPVEVGLGAARGRVGQGVTPGAAARHAVDAVGVERLHGLGQVAARHHRLPRPAPVGHRHGVGVAFLAFTFLY